MNALPERIVCAANRHDGITIMGLRHNDEFMCAAMARMQLSPTQQMSFKHSAAQGFLTNRGRWVDRKEAYEIAQQQEQVIRKTGGIDSRVLYSEDVY